MPKNFSAWVAAILIINIAIPLCNLRDVGAVECPDVKLIFARGSGGERWTDQNYQAFKAELEEKLKLVNLKYDFLDLDYPAISVGDIFTLLKTFVSGGEAYEFGDSINIGVNNLIHEVNETCPNTKFVVAGYSQGAMVVSKAVNFLNPGKVVYAATFGDPKIYLPEGFGAMPAACTGKNLSSYRIYVPDCRVYEGMLGSYRPYQPEGFEDKMGTWCNKTDIFCSTHFSINSHVSYVSDGLYTDASKVIFDKITRAFEIENKYTSLHDTAILIDSTGSMEGLIKKYKKEALALAEKTLAAGGRVALYDYRDIADNYEPKERCNFETCTIESFAAGLDEMSVNGGDDLDESLLSASFHVMQKLKWQFGSTKSLVILTDASYHNPDLDGTTFLDVVNLGKRIDPVSIYIITPANMIEDYLELANATGGEVVNSSSDLSILTNQIISRYNALPRVEDFDVTDTTLPTISNLSWARTADDGVKINFSGQAIVALNDMVLGIAEDNIIIGGIDFSRENNIRLVPIADNLRGMSTEIKLDLGRGSLKVPNSGRQ